MLTTSCWTVTRLHQGILESLSCIHCKYLNAWFECNDIVISVYSHYPLDLNAKSSDTKCVTLSDLAFRYLQSRVPNCYKLDPCLLFSIAHPKSGKGIKTTRYQDFIYKTLELGLLIKVHTFSCNIFCIFSLFFISFCVYKYLCNILSERNPMLLWHKMIYVKNKEKKRISQL